MSIRRAKAAKHIARIVIPDSHGNHIDERARAACLRDVRAIGPEQVVLLGDHLDCGGTFNAHQRTYTNEFTESYEDDVNACNLLLDDLQDAAPNAEFFYIEGNHEQHVERWAARQFASKKDAEGMLDHYGPVKRLKLKARGMHYYKRSEHYMGLSIPGAIKLGKCFFVHGVSHAKHSAEQHLVAFGANVVYGHVHTSQSSIIRTVTSDGYGAWCPGTLAKLQPLYKHTAPTRWTHGYAVQFVNAGTGRFVHYNVPIMAGESILLETINMIANRGLHAKA